MTDAGAADSGPGASRTPASGSSASGASDSVSVRVQLPYHLRNLAGVEGEVRVEVEVAGRVGGGRSDGPTVADLLDAVEARFPDLRGTIRDHDRGPRRAYLRFFTCGEDISHQGEAFPLPKAVVEGREVFRVVGAISGGTPGSSGARCTSSTPF